MFKYLLRTEDVLTFLDPVLGHEEAGLLTFEALQGLPRFSGHTHDDTQDVSLHLISQSW